MLHDCDSPACCNPSHLRVGTDFDNVQDCIDRKRRAQDRNHHQDSKYSRCLSETQVQEIRLKRFLKLATLKELAKEYGVSISAIDRAANARRGD